GGSSLAPSRPLAQPPVPAGPPNRCSWLHGVARARSSARPPSTMRRRARRGSAARRRCCSAGCGSRCRPGPPGGWPHCVAPDALGSRTSHCGWTACGRTPAGRPAARSPLRSRRRSASPGGAPTAGPSRSRSRRRRRPRLPRAWPRTASEPAGGAGGLRRVRAAAAPL
ncbi:unnamed protein product, partial [Prorocentrum cordatum]